MVPQPTTLLLIKYFMFC